MVAISLPSFPAAEARAIAVRLVCIVTGIVLGTTEARAGEPWPHEVVSGELRDEGDAWTAGAQGATVRLDGVATVKLAPDTVAHKRSTTSMNLGGASRTKTYVVDLDSGSLEIQNPKGSNRAVLVHAPKELSGMIRSGVMAVAAGPERVAVGNREGSCWVGVAGHFHGLRPGSAWSSQKFSMNPYPLLPAPSVELKRHALPALRGPASLDGLHWSQVQGAQGYRVTLSDEQSRPLQILDAANPDTPLPFRPLSPGKFSVTVSAIDENGMPGLPSREETIQVVGVTLPAGGLWSEDGAIEVVDDEEVTLDHADGLQIAYGKSAVFSPAPRAVRVFRNEPSLVRVKHAKDGSSFSFLVRPRKLRLAVRAGPKKVTWPHGTVELRIDGAIPESVELRPTVTVGIREVRLPFNRGPRGMTALLPMPRDAGPGPWVVRLEVTDQFGHFVGRDFVEIGTEENFHRKTTVRLP